MAEVVDIIHKITYEANEDVILSLNKAFGNQFKQLQELYAEQKRLDELRQSGTIKDLTQINALNAAYNKTTQQINAVTAAIGKEFVANEKLNTSLKKTGSNFNALSVNINRILSDAPYGFIGIANNIVPAFESIEMKMAELRAAGRPTSAIFSEIGSAIFGTVGIINLAILAFSLFGSTLLETGKQTEKTKKETDDLTKSIQDQAKLVGEETTELNKLYQTATNVSLSYKQRGDAVDELQKKFPEYFGNLDREKILNGEVKDSYDALTRSIIDRAKAKGRENLIQKTATDLAELEIELEKIKKRDANNFILVDNSTIKNLEANIFLKKQQLQQLTLQDQLINSIGKDEAYWLDQNAKKKYEENEKRQRQLALMTEEERRDFLSEEDRSAKERVRQADKVRLAYENLREEIRKALKELAQMPSVKDIEKEAKEIRDRQFGGAPVNRDTGILDSSFGDGIDETTLKNQAAIAKAVEKQKEEQKKKKDAQDKQDLQKINRFYNQALDLTVTGLNNIFNAKIRFLDMEQAAQQTRIERATLLAERGNAQILEDELNRMQTLEAERERIVQRQLQLNALLQASQTALVAVEALKTVTNAGATGDPYSTPVRIAAAVAALAAGFATVASLTTAFRGFADGGYVGDGGKYQPKGIVHGGEFVMTKEKTAQYKPLLEAIHNGTIEKAYPVYNNYASRTEMKETNKRLDSIYEVLLFDKTEVKNMVSGGDLVTVTTKHSQRQRNMFKKG